MGSPRKTPSRIPFPGCLGSGGYASTPTAPAPAPAPRGRRQPPRSPCASAAALAPRPREKSKRTALNRRRERDPTDAETHALYGPLRPHVSARALRHHAGASLADAACARGRRAPWEPVGDVAARLGLPGVGWLLRVLTGAQAGRPRVQQGSVWSTLASSRSPEGKGGSIVFPAGNNCRPLPCVKRKRTSAGGTSRGDRRRVGCVVAVKRSCQGPALLQAPDLLRGVRRCL